MKVNLVGNGFSRDLFVDNGYRTVGFNYNNAGMDLMVVLGKRVLKNVVKDKNFKSPIVTSTETKRDQAYVNSYKYQVVDKIKLPNSRHVLDDNGNRVCHDYERIKFPIKINENGGHSAYQWLVNKGATEIHMWGFDLLFENTIASYTDSIVGKEKENWYKSTSRFINIEETWIDTWNRIISVDTFIYTPPSKSITIEHENVTHVIVDKKTEDDPFVSRKIQKWT
jgi:hypothetical protein